jgi:hypothetical protein
VLFGRELEAEILGETVGIAPNCLVEALRQNAVKRSQVAIEDDSLAADGMNGRQFGVRHGISRAQHSPGGDRSTIKKNPPCGHWFGPTAFHDVPFATVRSLCPRFSKRSNSKQLSELHNIGNGFTEDVIVQNEDIQRSSAGITPLYSP